MSLHNTVLTFAETGINGRSREHMTMAAQQRSINMSLSNTQVSYEAYSMDWGCMKACLFMKFNPIRASKGACGQYGRQVVRCQVYTATTLHLMAAGYPGDYLVITLL